MRKVIAAINMTVDGYCDHTAVVPDEKIHEHYTELLNQAGVLLYGRITYQLMEFWRTVVDKPTGNKAMDDFALVMNRTPKIVFSRTLTQVDWDSATLAQRDLASEVHALKLLPGRDIYAGSPGLIVSLANLGLIDEFQLCIHPVLAAGGLPLFKNLDQRTLLTLTRTKPFSSGAVIHYYEPVRNS